MAYPTLSLALAQRYVMAAALIAAAAATARPLAGRGAGSSQEPASPLPGAWRAVANGDDVNALLREGETVWVAAEGGGVVRWDLATGAYRQWLAPQDGLPSGDVRDLVRDRNGSLWAATADGLARLEAGAERWRRTTAAPPGPSPSTTALALAPDGALWVGFEQRWDPVSANPATGAAGAFVGGGVARFDVQAGAWGAVFRAEPVDSRRERFLTVPSDNVTDLAFGRGGLLWVATRPYRAVCGVEGDTSCPEGAGAWINLGGGLAATDGGLWAAWQPTDGRSCFGDHVTAVAGDEAGRMWAATLGRGLHVFRAGLDSPTGCGEGHVYYREPRRDYPGIPYDKVHAVSVAGDGRVWVGLGDGRGAAALDHRGTFEDPAEPWASDDVWERAAPGTPERPGVAVTSLVPGPDALVVGVRGGAVGEGHGVHVRRTGAWSAFRTADEGLPGNRVTALAVDPGTADLWVGTAGRGVARWDGRAWRTWRAADAEGPASDHVTAVAVDGAGRVWVAATPTGCPGGGCLHDGGVAVFDGASWTVYDPANSRLPDSRVQALAVDDSGSVWIGTGDRRAELGRGVAVLDPDTGAWSFHNRATAGAGFGGNGVSGIAVDPGTGDVWLATHRAPCGTGSGEAGEDCEPDKVGGGVSRWDGRGWTAWRKPESALAAYGDEGNLATVLFDRRGSQVWAGSFVAGRGFHWPSGRGIDSAINACPRHCPPDDWSSWVFPGQGEVLALALDDQGRVWSGASRGGRGTVPASGGVKVRTGSVWRTHNRANTGLPSDEVTALAAFADGMWVGTLDHGAALWLPVAVEPQAYLPSVARTGP